MSTRSLWASVTPMLVAWLFLTTAPAAVHAQPREEATADNVFTGTLDVRMGQRVFRQQCGRCHGRDGAGGELGPDLTEGFRSASTDAGLFKIVREGIPNTQMIGISRRSTDRRGRPPMTLTKLGQKPRKQERSVLQVDWLMRRLRPSSVSTGSTDRQLDLIEQSPQPSQTSVLMTTRVRSGARRPRLDRRRFSVAQI